MYLAFAHWCLILMWTNNVNSKYCDPDVPAYLFPENSPCFLDKQEEGKNETDDLATQQNTPPGLPNGTEKLPLGGQGQNFRQNRPSHHGERIQSFLRQTTFSIKNFSSYILALDHVISMTCFFSLAEILGALPEQSNVAIMISVSAYFLILAQICGGLLRLLEFTIILVGRPFLRYLRFGGAMSGRICGKTKAKYRKRPYQGKPTMSYKEYYRRDCECCSCFRYKPLTPVRHSEYAKVVESNQHLTARVSFLEGALMSRMDSLSNDIPHTPRETLPQPNLDQILTITSQDEKSASRRPFNDKIMRHFRGNNSFFCQLSKIQIGCLSDY